MKDSFFVALLEKNPIQREGIASFLKNGGFETCQHFHSLCDLYDLPQPDGQRLVFLINVEQEEGTLIAAVGELHHRFPGCAVIVLADDSGDPELIRAIRSEADGLLLKRFDQDVLVKSLELVLLGEKVFPVGRLLKLCAGGICGEGRDLDGNGSLERLSAREREVLVSLIAGNSNKVIARQFGITEATVKVHVKAILRKTFTKNRTQAAVWARRNGLQSVGDSEWVQGYSHRLLA